MNVKSAVRLAVLIPIFNDFRVAAELLTSIDIELEGQVEDVEIVLVDDGSTEEPTPLYDLNELRVVSAIRVVRLRRNLGHQRAIAIGLTWVSQELQCDLVVVMDGDGQDRPEDIPALVREAVARNLTHMVFAERETKARRPEGLLFKLGYISFKIIHRLLVGFPVRVGNFSAVPFECLDQLVAVSELWKHYAAGVINAKIPMATVPAPRARRRRDGTKMDYPSLLVHGLSAISIFSGRVGARLMIFLMGCTAMLMGVLVISAIWGRFLIESVPGLALAGVGAALFVFFQIVLVFCGLFFFVMSSRQNLDFIPLRDFKFFILETFIIDTSRQTPPVPVEDTQLS